MGPLSRLIAHTIESTQESWLIQTAVDDMLNFATMVETQWRQNKLSEVDQSVESLHLDQATLDKTNLPLWRVMRSILFATTIALAAVASRLLADKVLAAKDGTLLSHPKDCSSCL